MVRRLCTLGLLAIVGLGSPGCLVGLYTSLLGIDEGELVLEGFAEMANCPVAATPNQLRQSSCDFSLPNQVVEESLVGYIVTESLGAFGVVLDPLIVELPADAPDISGTFDDGAGHSGELIVYPALPFVPVDDTRTLTARPGKQLVVLDLPNGVPTAQVNYHFQLRIPPSIGSGAGVAPEVRAMLTGKLTANGKTFYQPLLPCTTDFTAVPALGISRSTTATPITFPPAAGAGCAATTRYVFNAPTDICDLDNDRDVDATDLAAIAARQGRRAAAGDPRDVNNDLAIDANDLAVCRARCTGQCAMAPRTYYLAEGSTGSFFDTDVLIANPNQATAAVSIQFLTQDGVTISDARVLPAMSRTTIRADELRGLENAAFSTAVTSIDGSPLVVERTMRWGDGGYGAHTEKASAGTALDWYFAEGAQGFYSTYFLLVNPTNTANVAHVTYFREGLDAVTRDYALAPFARLTVDAGRDAALVDQAFGAHVVFDRPGAAERSMYFSTDTLWSGGHASAGVTSPSTSWFLAEGATGSLFTTFILIANPNDQPADVTVTYLPASGIPVRKTLTVAPRARVTRNIATEDATLASTAVATQVESTRPVIVERSQYWPNPNWAEAHNSAGVTSLATRWGLAEGRVGGPEHYQTYILLANPGSVAADVTITFLRTNGATITKTFSVPAASRFNVATGADGPVPELVDEEFAAVIASSQPIAVERAMYSDAGGVTWAAGTNATATRLP